MPSSSASSPRKQQDAQQGALISLRMKPLTRSSPTSTMSFGGTQQDGNRSMLYEEQQEDLIDMLEIMMKQDEKAYKCNDYILRHRQQQQKLLLQQQQQLELEEQQYQGKHYLAYKRQPSIHSPSSNRHYHQHHEQQQQQNHHHRHISHCQEEEEQQHSLTAVESCGSGSCSEDQEVDNNGEDNDFISDDASSRISTASSTSPSLTYSASPGGSHLISTTTTTTRRLVSTPPTQTMRDAKKTKKTFIQKLGAKIRKTSIVVNTRTSSNINSHPHTGSPTSVSRSSEIININPTSMIDTLCREKMCEWSYRVADHFHVSRDIVSTSFSYLDRFVDSIGYHHHDSHIILDRTTFKLAAMTSLYMATKLFHNTIDHNGSGYHRYHAGSQQTISMTSLADLSRGEFTVNHINEMERIILKKINWALHPPTIQDFIHYLIKAFLAPTLVKDIEKNSNKEENISSPKPTKFSFGQERQQARTTAIVNPHHIVYGNIIKAIQQRAVFFAELALFDYSFVTKPKVLVAISSIINAMEGMNNDESSSTTEANRRTAANFYNLCSTKNQIKFMDIIQAKLNIKLQGDVQEESEKESSLQSTLDPMRNRLWYLYSQSIQYNDDGNHLLSSSQQRQQESNSKDDSDYNSKSVTAAADKNSRKNNQQSSSPTRSKSSSSSLNDTSPVGVIDVIDDQMYDC